MFSNGGKKNALSSQEPQAPSPYSFLSSQVTLGEPHRLSGPTFSRFGDNKTLCCCCEDTMNCMCKAFCVPKELYCFT